MTTFEKTWTTVMNVDVNGASADDQSTAEAFIYQLYLMLTDTGTAGFWTVQKASNGVNWADDATYAWASVSDVTCDTHGSWVADGSINTGNNHSWIELKSPDNFPTTGKNLYILIDCGGYSGSDQTKSVSMHFGTTTADAATGGVNKRPTLDLTTWYSRAGYKDAAYGVWAWANWNTPAQTSTTYGGLSGIRCVESYDAAHINYFHGGRTTEGAFFFHNTKEGGSNGTSQYGGMVMNLDTPRSNVVDPWPVIICTGRILSTWGYFYPLTGAVSNSNGSSWNVSANGASDIRMWNSNGTNTGRNTVGGRSYLQTFGCYNNTYAINSQGTINGSSLDNKCLVVPIYLFDDTVPLTNSTLRGRMFDIGSGPLSQGATVGQGLVEPLVGTPESYYLGGYWWPGDAVPIT